MEAEAQLAATLAHRQNRKWALIALQTCTSHMSDSLSLCRSKLTSTLQQSDANVHTTEQAEREKAAERLTNASARRTLHKLVNCCWTPPSVKAARPAAQRQEDVSISVKLLCARGASISQKC